MLAEWVIGLLLAIPSPLLTVPIVHAEDKKDIWLSALIDCESMGSTTVRVLDTNGKYSHGLLQFQLSTWLSYGKEFGATKKNIYDGELQKIVARNMLDKGLWRHWYNCSKRITSELGSYPASLIVP